MNAFIGTCVDQDIVEHIFGSISEFARQVEMNSDDFQYQDVLVKYDPVTDIHYFYACDSNNKFVL